MITVTFSIEKNNPLLSQCPLCHLASCTPTKSDLYLANSLATVVSEPGLLQAPYMQRTKSHVPYPSFRSYQRISSSLRHIYLFRHKASFYGKVLLATRPTPKLEDRPLSAFRDCLFNIFVVPSILDAVPPTTT
jgi:hypothetical protein